MRLEGVRMKISAYILAIILASTIRALSAVSSYRHIHNVTSVGDVEVGDLDVEKKTIGKDTVSVEEQSLILLVHESYRAQIQSTNMMKLRYHAGIAEKAQFHADACVFQHDTRDDRAVAELPGVYIGQNICMGHASWSDCMTGWANEKANFEYGIGSKNGGMIGHYTQLMLWKTMAIGCGFNSCNGSPLYVCNYAYGQYVGDLKVPWKPGKQCADCPNNCTPDGFCDCGGKFCSSTYEIMTPACQCQFWWLVK